jgi:hypothetical protein
MWLILPQDCFGNEEITSNRIPCKRTEIELWLWAIKDSCGSRMLHFLSMWLTIDEVLLNYFVKSPKRVTLLEHCISSHCAWPLNEVSLNSKHKFLSYEPDKEWCQRAITLLFVKWCYCFSALHFLLLCLTIVWSCFELQPVVFKLWSGQKKEMEK